MKNKLQNFQWVDTDLKAQADAMALAQIEDLKSDLWYLMETDQFSVVKKELQEKWLSDKPWRLPKKKHKTKPTHTITLPKLPLKNSFALYYADFKAARDQ